MLTQINENVKGNLASDILQKLQTSDRIGELIAEAIIETFDEYGIETEDRHDAIMDVASRIEFIYE